MKTKLKALKFLALLAVLFFANIASAVYSPNLGRWLTRDLIAEDGGVNLYEFVENDPLTKIDPLGKDAITVGPATLFYNQDDLTPSEKIGERAHEKQHRDDFLKNQPGWKKEQRGFDAEAKALRAEIARLKAKNCLTEADKKNLAAAEAALSTAEGIAKDPQQAVDYWNTAARRWYQKEATVPPEEKPVRFYKGPKGELWGGRGCPPKGYKPVN